MLDMKNALDKLNISLDLNRKVVGVRFLYTKKEFLEADAKEARTKIPYCVMVKIATHGFGLKATLETSGCGGATRALGLEKPKPEFESGCEYHSFGLYKDLTIAKNVVDNITLCKHEIYGVMVKPLEAFNENPDVVIIVTDAYNGMRIVQGYTYSYGTKTDFKLTGNQAVCSECTAYPYEKDSINISMFCSGTRYLAGWETTEMAVGLSYSKFLGTAEGVFRTINGAEGNSAKKHIKKKLEMTNLSNPGIYENDAYYIRLSNRDDN
ncbi:DUF169 domain-containing protein [Lutispora thermophila]|uniref:Uncharacterized conserved protein, DUF169 family n=1 Tax=Lutispora thermophila DSM 19022 TaxID=1122184 RepID=A0A1M6D2R4_9FIRM|nr:DUF169 domain-containing protein [Lutispora thermophila]SHI67542.1 Uncharacterized conserved protein, DUF169 family [Lutispora thermophila DSM 19022]